MADIHTQNVKNSRDVILNRIGILKPKIAIILGSGLGGLADRVENAVTIPYEDLPGFPVLTIAGHVGVLIAGKLSGVDVLVFKGRKHFYETHDAMPLKTVIRTIKAAGVETLFLSNAAGSLKPHIKVCEMMMITDHINQMGFNPLVGSNEDDFGERFLPMTDAWDSELRRRLKKTAQQQNITLHEGVYIAFRGPSFETPAEIRMAQGMGGDAIGMSSVPECILARHCGLRVVGCSCITNMGAGLSDEKISHKHTLENAGRTAANFEKFVTSALPNLL